GDVQAALQCDSLGGTSPGRGVERTGRVRSHRIRSVQAEWSAVAGLIRAIRVVSLGVLLAAVPFTTSSREPSGNPDAPADLIVVGRIYTGDRPDPVEAFAVRGD